MVTVCCVCKVIKYDDGVNDGLVSHGYCIPCEAEVNRELDKNYICTLDPLLDVCDSKGCEKICLSSGICMHAKKKGK